MALAVNKVGTNGPDHLNGTNGDDNLVGLGGDDELFAFRGDDTLLGGSGKDVVTAETDRGRSSAATRTCWEVLVTTSFSAAKAQTL